MVLCPLIRDHLGMTKPSPTHSGATLLVSLGKAIKLERKEKGVSHEDLVLLISLDSSFMGGIERGEHSIALINLRRLLTV